MLSRQQIDSIVHCGAIGVRAIVVRKPLYIELVREVDRVQEPFRRPLYSHLSDDEIIEQRIGGAISIRGVKVMLDVDVEDESRRDCKHLWSDKDFVCVKCGSGHPEFHSPYRKE